MVCVCIALNAVLWLLLPFCSWQMEIKRFDALKIFGPDGQVIVWDGRIPTLFGFI